MLEEDLPKPTNLAKSVLPGSILVCYQYTKETNWQKIFDYEKTRYDYSIAVDPKNGFYLSGGFKCQDQRYGTLEILSR